MAETSSPQPDAEGPGTVAGRVRRTEFHWQSFFQGAGEALFLLNRQRRILFVNRAWEALTGLQAVQVRGLACTRRPAAEAGPWESLARALSPTPEVLEGKVGSTRRLVAGIGTDVRWWDIEFFPVRQESGALRILGKIKPVGAGVDRTSGPLPEKLSALRERLAAHHGFDQLGSEPAALRRLGDQVRLACQTRCPVLIVGEPGTGKQWVARTIHYQGDSKEKTFAALDCGALPEFVLAAALFGDVGLARQSDVGMLYLKEPARLPRDLQARLCDVLDESSGPRVVAGSCVDQAVEVRAGRLCDDLHWALGTLVIGLPPLRERGADLPRLVDRLLERINGERERRIAGLSAAAWDLVRAYDWPGNLRELFALLASACLRTKGELVETEDFPAYFRLAVNLDRMPMAELERRLPLDPLLEKAERRLILLALRLSQGNKTRAAEMLSIWRQRLVRRMEALGITDPEKGKE